VAKTVTKLTPAFDTVVKGGRLIDPKNGIDGIRDIGITKGRVAAVAPTLDPGKAKIIDAAGLIVTPGLIDTHAHVYEHVSGDFGLNPDLVGIRTGVTTVVDQGGPSALTFDGFRKFIVEKAKTRVLAFISAYLAGGLLAGIPAERAAPCLGELRRLGYRAAAIGRVESSSGAKARVRLERVAEVLLEPAVAS